MPVSLSALRVSVEGDSSSYVESMRRKAAADEAGAASSVKVAGAMDRGRAAAGRYETALAKWEQAARTGTVTADQQARGLAGLAGKYEKTADAASLTAAGYRELAQAVSGLTAVQAAQLAQVERSSAAAARATAANDNQAESVGRVGSAFAEAGKFALAHPILVAAGSVAAAKALSGYAATAGGAMARASAATAAYAAGNAAMGGQVAAAASVAAAGLKLGEQAALSASAGLAGYAETVGGLTTATGLLSRGLGAVVPLLGPIALAFAAFEVGRAVIGKANSDLAKLIELGERAEKLDVSAGFVKGFESIGGKLRLQVSDMQEALQRASDFVRQRFEQPDALSSYLSDLKSKGYTSEGLQRVQAQASTANTGQERVEAILAAMKELEAAGHRFAAIDLTGKAFGPKWEETLQRGRATVEQIVGYLQETQAKQPVDDGTVRRAVELSLAIEKTKREISEAWNVTFDFSRAAMLVDEIWLRILQSVKSLVEWLNGAIDSVTAFFSRMAQGISDAFAAVASSAAFKAVMEGARAVGLISAQPSGGDEPLTFTVKPKVGSRETTQMFGPAAPKPEATKAIREANAAAREGASAYELLIKRTEDRIDELDLEARSVGKTTDEVVKLKLAHDLERAAMKSGIDVTEEMRGEWDKLGSRLGDATRRLNEAKRAQDLLLEGQREVGRGLTAFVEEMALGAGKLTDALASLSKGFASSGLKAILTGEGPLAGVLGTASLDRNQPGGLLGGITPGAVKSALKEGAASGTSDGLADFFKGTPLANVGTKEFAGGAAGALAIAGSYGVGRQASSPTMGAVGGAVSGAIGGAVLGSYVPVVGTAVGAVVGGLVGGAAGLFGAKKEREQKERQRKLDAWNAFADALPSIQTLQASLRGEGQGDVTKAIAASQAEIAKAAKVAAEAGQQQIADDLVRDGALFAYRLRKDFVAGFNATVQGMNDGFGMSSPFAGALKATQDLREKLTGWLGDVNDAYAGNAIALRMASEAAVNMALSTLDSGKALSATATRMAEIRGTAAGLVDVLVKLGLSAEDAARVVEERTTRALDALRSSFETDLTRKIDTAQGRDYANDLRDLIAEVGTMRADAGSLGLGQGRVDEYLSSAAQKIVDEAQLTSQAFDSLVAYFPELTGQVHAFTGAVVAASSATEIAARKLGYADRLFAAGNDTSTLEGQLAAFDRAAQREREEETKAGGEALVDLETTLAAERLKILRDYSDQAADTERQRLEEASKAFDTFARNIKGYVDGLRAGSSSPLAPKDRLTAAQAQYDAQLALARTGDRTAMDGITGYASDLLDAAKAFYASSGQFQTVFQSVTGQLTALPTQVSAEQFIVNAIDKMRGDLLGSLLTNFSTLDTSVNGLLDFGEFKVGVGPLATDAQARAIFNELDTNGDGQLSKLELIRSQATSTTTNVATAVNRVEVGNDLAEIANSHLASSRYLNQVSTDNLVSQSDSLYKIVGSNAQIAGDTRLVGANTFNIYEVLRDIRNIVREVQYNTALTDPERNQYFGRKAAGGWITGPGTGTSDTAGLYALSNGEFVVRAEAARRAGTVLEALNDNRGIALPTIGVPTPVAAMPAIDFSPVVAAIRRLEGRIGALEDTIAAAVWGAGDHVRAGVDVVAAGQQRARTDAVQNAGRPKRSGTNG